MCGISAVVSPGAVDLLTVVQMNDAIRHRGPDDEGYVLFGASGTKVAGGFGTAADTWQLQAPYAPHYRANEVASSNAHVILGHRRLSILDLSPLGHQPMSDPTGRYWLVYNGEIYNYLEIKRELAAKNHSFTTGTDTEVILAAYKEWGPKCQDKFNGMWAFILYDSVDRTIFASRDRFGIKPLYYWVGPCGSIFFASEIKQFTQIKGWDSVLNGARAYDYLHYSLTDHTDETMFDGVMRLPPGHFLHETVGQLLQTATLGKLAVKKWYQPPVDLFQGSFDEAAMEFRHRFLNSVKEHLRSDVPVGSALSGGLDSSSIVSSMHHFFSQTGVQHLQKTFSSCSADPRFDERNWMELVVDATGVEAHYVYPDGKDIFSLTEKIIWHQDEPYDSQSAFLGYHVFGEANRSGVKVLLNGQGADEYLSCYSQFRSLRQGLLLKRGYWMRLWHELESTAELTSLLATMVYSRLSGAMKLKLGSVSKRHRNLDRVIRHKLLSDVKHHPYDNASYGGQQPRDLSNFQLYHNPLQRYLRWEDRNSMAHSVEARVPFLDHRLVEFAHSLPLDYLDAPLQTKRVLVESMKGILPESVRLRKDKKGFITPERRWFTNDLKNDFLAFFEQHAPSAQGVVNISEAREYLRRMQAGIEPFDLAYWRIMLFCVWMKRFHVSVK